MLLCNIAWAIFALAVGSYAADQDIITILNQQTGISTFIGYLQQFPDLIDLLNNGTFSVPNDEAISTFTSANQDVTEDELLALLQYHCVNGTHPSATFGLQPLFAPTLLSNTSYANVTGGQVVEITMLNNTPTVLSGVKAASHVVEPDILYIGGLIQIIDSVLTIPISFPATITKAGLTDLIALLNKGGWLTPTSPAATIINTLSDLTVFGPNSPQFGASFTGWDGLTAASLLEIFQYSIIQGEVLYSSQFKNNSKLPTLLNQFSLTLTNISGGFYVDTSLITTTDYLTSNGVLQIIDSPLNPNTTGKIPTSTPAASSPGGSSGLSAAAGAGIGIAIGALILGGALAAALYIRTKRRGQGSGGMFGRRQRLDGESRERVTHPSDPDGPPPTYELDAKSIRAGRQGARDATSTHVFEIHHPPKPPSPLEIDGNERSRISITIQGSPPRHLGFQARY
ncbi:hypothetical protein LTS07_002840 [Exophiala sideris]|uniref:FAS1 domain-containing protein n=1 Tax=Exophiala sideris TaxID=1016849 RepID=A0ABR0JKD3_9EURO|nr:hypothetical protein LTS07_002840 [Exophiala sideris]KAK5066327.1 hypothetical protein LTR69_002846 [Exophiala sideris]KAK5187004.1 hypothetical protein LTR44_001011 [Eurotiomycetes sp. CCFEE 6388]